MRDIITKAIRSVSKKYAQIRMIKANNEALVEALKLVLAKRLLETSDKVLQAALETVLEVLSRSDNVKEAVDYLKEWSAQIPELASSLLASQIPSVIENIYTAGFYGAGESVSVGLSLSLKDLDAIDVIGKQNLFWLGEHYNTEVKERFDRLLMENFEEGLSREQFAQRLIDSLGPWSKAEDSYWNGLADHIASKTQELGRVSAYESMGVEYVKVKAILDERTSQICRDLHGRIISVKKLRAQYDNIMAAQTKEELIAAAAWLDSFTGKTKDLPDNVASPPYHYRCRTTTVAYLEHMSDVGRIYQYYDGNERRNETIAFHHMDKELGREFIVTDGSLKHIAERHPEITEDKLKAALRSIKRVGESTQNKGQLITLSENGVILVFRDNVVWTAFTPKGNSLKYFKDSSIGGFKKWKEKLKSIYELILSQ